MLNEAFRKCRRSCKCQIIRKITYWPNVNINMQPQDMIFMYLFLTKTWLKSYCWLIKLHWRVYLFLIILITNYYKFSGLKQHRRTMLQLGGWIKSLSGLDWFLCSGSYKVKIKESSSLALTWRLLGRLFQTHSGCWQNLMASSCRIEVPIFLLAVRGHSQILEAVHTP